MLAETEGPFFAGSDLTVADFYLLALNDGMKTIMGIYAREKWPFVKAHFEEVIKKSPETAQYLATRIVH